MKMDLAQYLRDNSVEEFRALMEQAKNPLELLLESLASDPRDKELREALLDKIVMLPPIERDIAVSCYYQVMQPLGIRRQTIQEEINRKIREMKTVSLDDKKNKAELLVELAMASAEFFCDEKKDSYARFRNEGHWEIWPLKARGFKRWLTRLYYNANGKVIATDALSQALGLLDALASAEECEHKLSLRVTEYDDARWYDLANKDWQVVRISADGWEVIDDPPILFHRYKNTAPQVLPQSGGRMESLYQHLNLKNVQDKVLLDAYLIFSLIADLPHPVPILYGDKGAAKSTAQRIIRRLIDPAHQDIMTIPTNKNEFALMLMTNYSPCFDNLDGLQHWQSDLLCMSATGGGFSKRELYTDLDEVIVKFIRCPTLNGINQVASRDDLLDRALLFQLEHISEEARMEERVLWEEFERDRPYILGAMFDALAQAMRLYPEIKLARLTRMADFCRWGCAIATALGYDEGEFLSAYHRNIREGVNEAVMADQVATAIIEFVQDNLDWEGTATELLDLLSDIPGIDTRAKNWPKSPHVLSRKLNKAKSVLAAMGVSVEKSKDKQRKLTIRYQDAGELTSEESAADTYSLEEDEDGLSPLEAAERELGLVCDVGEEDLIGEEVPF